MNAPTRWRPSAEYLVLHALRVKGLAADPDVSALSGLPAAEVSQQMTALAATGLVRRRDGRLPGAMLTPAGKQAHQALLAAEVDRAAARAALGAAYPAFVPLNGEFKQLCGRFQMRDGGSTPNDHQDEQYDCEIIGQLGRVHERAVAILLPVAPVLGRFGRYPIRLGRALDRIRAGELAAFTRPMSGSYHDIWMELHQDLLVSLGRQRSAADEE